MSAARPIARARVTKFPSIRNPSSLRSSPAPQQAERSLSNRACKNPTCDSSDIREDGGQLICFNCGTVVSDSVIVNDVTFGEAPSGAALVQGTTVHQGQRYAKPSGTSFRRGGRTAEDAQESTNRAAKEEIIRLANTLYVSHAVDSAYQLYKLGRHHGFHRTMMDSVAICLYIACREKPGNTLLLIDIAEKIRRNVFDLGAIYKAFIRQLNYEEQNLKDVPLINIEPLLYKYAKRLEFGDHTRRVADDAAKILSRMDRDWMVTGRQPQALCGASLILAARMHNFRRSIREVVFVVKAGDATVSRRMDEFKRLKVGRLSVQNFLSIGHLLKDPSAEPPSVYEAREKLGRAAERKRQSGTVVISDDESSDASIADNEPSPRYDEDGFAIPALPGSMQSASSDAPHGDAEQASGMTKVESATRGKKRRRGDSVEAQILQLITPSSSDEPPSVSDEVNLATIAAQSAEPRTRRRSRAVNAQVELPEGRISSPSSARNSPAKSKRGKRKAKAVIEQFVPTEADLYAENELEHEITTIVQKRLDSDTDELFKVTAARAKAIAEAEREREGRQNIEGSEVIDENEFDDDPEVANCLLSAAEIEVKERIWVTHNHDWLRRQQEMMLDKAMLEAMGKKKRKANKGAARTASQHDTPASTPAEAAQRMLAKKNNRPAFSRHINYERLQQIYGMGSATETPMKKSEEKDLEEVEESDVVGGAAEAKDPNAEDEDENEDEEEEDEDDDEEPYESEGDGYDNVDFDELGVQGFD